jgi:hypothetical protein
VTGRCFWHGNEPLRPEHTTICGECHHAFTAAELVLRDLAVRLELLAADVTSRLGQLGPSTNEQTLLVVLADLEDELDGLAGSSKRRAPEDVDVCPLCSHDL